MGDLLHAKTEAQLQRARRLQRIALYIALASLTATIAGVISFQLFHSQTHPAFIILPNSGFFLAGGLWLIGGSTAREDREVRQHRGFGPIRNPLSRAMRNMAWTLFLFAAMLVVFSFINFNKPQ
jgi:hypothetical protein